MELSVLSDGGGGGTRAGKSQDTGETFSYFFSLDCPNFWHVAWRCSPGNFSAVGSVETACAFEK